MPKRIPRARTLKGDPKLAYYDSAGGVAEEPVILLLHQSLARSEDWENIFPRLATRYRTIAYDARGHGTRVAVRVADGHHELTDLQLVGVAEPRRREVAVLRAQDGEVGQRVGADYGEARLAPVGERRAACVRSRRRQPC